MGASVAPTPAALVAAEFLSYLQLHKGLPITGYLQPPQVVPDSWETYTYRLQIAGRNPPPAAPGRPLALRVYAGPEGLPKLRRDWILQTRLAELNYPVARPVLVEEDPAYLGGPFLVMEWVEGERLLERLLNNYLILWWDMKRMAQAHALLHQVPVDGLPVPERSFLDRQLETLQTVVTDYDLQGLAAGVDWLRARRPPEPEPPRLLHLDLHAKNLLIHQGQVAAVLDWSEADFGDRLADVGQALMMIDVAPVEGASWIDRTMLPIGRFLTHHFYLFHYRRRLPVDRRRLRYYLAWGALWRLSWFGRWLNAGPHVMGYKPAAVQHVRPALVAELERYFQRHSGVAVRLGLPLPATRSSFPNLPLCPPAAPAPGAPAIPRP